MSASGNLKSFNTLAVDSQAAQLEIVTSTEQLQQLARRCDPERMLILGEGSNVVLAPELNRSVVVMRTHGIDVEDLGTHVELTVAAGENWHQLVMWSIEAGYCGLENLALIPGSVGAAPVQNIGAYGVELADLLVSVEVVELGSGKVFVLNHDDCRFGYRDSRFKQDRGQFAITSLTLRLHRDRQPVLDYPDLRAELQRLNISSPTVAQVASAVITIRQAKLPDPGDVANVGSFFKNPLIGTSQLALLLRNYPTLKSFPVVEQGRDTGLHKLSAAQLIDLSGFKERGTAQVSVWPQQPLVLVNYAAPTADAIIEFANSIREEVAARFEIQLEIEPDLIGFD